MKRMLIAAALAVLLPTLAIADDLEVNKGDWDQVPEADRQQIETLLKDTFKGQEFTIAPTETGESAAALGFGRRPICKAVCDFSAAAFTIGCGSIGGGAVGAIAGAVCAGLAAQAKQKCYAKCEM